MGVKKAKAAEPEEVVVAEPTPEEVAVAEAAETLAEAAKVHAAAQAELDAAKAAHAAAVKALEPVAVRGKHIFVQYGGTAEAVMRDAPKGYNADAPDYRLLLDGVNVEHVAEVKTDDGDIWVYRQM